MEPTEPSACPASVEEGGAELGRRMAWMRPEGALPDHGGAEDPDLEELRRETVETLASLSAEQLRLVLAYALCLIESRRIPSDHTLQGLLEELA